MKDLATLEQTEAMLKLDYRETANIVQGFFAWNPGPLSSILIMGLSKFMRPLEHGTYAGRALLGEPHRSSWVIASPLTVFVLPETGRRHKIFLAARLRSTGPVNLIEDPPGESKNRKRPGKAVKRKGRSKKKGAATEKTRGKLKGNGRTEKDKNRRSSRKLSKAGLSRAMHHHGEETGCDYELESLLAIQRESQVALTVVPVVRAYHQLVPDAPATTVGTKVYRFYPLHLLRKGTNWARTMRTARVKNCRPIVLSKWLEGRHEEDLCSQAGALRVELLSHIESERRACTGPPLPPKWEVKRRVLADPVLSVYMQDYALREGMTREAVLAEARDYVEEIQSDYRVGVARYFCKVVDFLFDRFLDGVDVDRDGIRFLAECDSRSRIVIVCNHKSYADSLLIGYTMFRSGMVPPQQAAGQNMDFFPMGWLLRHSGAFYIRRSFMGETLYKEVFCAYVRYILAENYTSVVYLEGTRTRDGKPAKPKIGYMGILEDALQMGVCPDITLVPVYLGFDKIPEEPSHVKEMSGARKVSETMTVFAKIIASIRTRLGKAYVKFGTPMSFKALLDEHGLRGAAEVACGEINKITPVTSRSLVGCALLENGTTWVNESEYERTVSDLLDYCERHYLPMAVDADHEGVVAALEQYIEEGYVERTEREGERGFRVEGYNRRFLEYNKNIQLAHFLEPALAAIAARKGDEVSGDNARIEESVRFLKDLFAEEFVLSPAVSIGSLEPDDRACSHLFCSLLDSYLEGYLVSCRAMDSINTDEPVSIDEALNLCFSAGEDMLESGVIRREESLSRIVFKNSLKNWRKMGFLNGVNGLDDEGRETTLLVPGERFGDRDSYVELIRGFLKDNRNLTEEDREVAG